MTHIEQDDPEQQKQEIAGLFSRAAPTYDRVGPRFFTYFGRRLVELAQIPSGAQVLDIATGKGAVLFPAAKAAGVKGRVTGIDLAEGMVRETSREIQRLELSNAEMIQMDAENLQFLDESFDCITCGFALFFFPNLDRALAEIIRVLKPNGKLAITSWEHSEDNKLWDWLNELVKAYLPPEDEKNEPGESSDPAEPDLFSPDGIKKVLETRGFNIIHLSAETDGFIYTDEEEWWAAQWSHGGRSTLEDIEEKHGAVGLERYKSDVFKGLRAIKQTDGIHDISRVIYAVAVKS